ncbi:nucleotidyl transferase AbiEii/AbiGii toxin family protein [Patescibacteria group bacterium]|nr:nucleotidyl transferase AbiEii/AbiGii toxin family protein [Patescibacteria group bacterium]
MFTKALPPTTLQSLKETKKISGLKPAYLAGGTALTLHLGHRLSEDLDFFTPKKFSELSLISELKQKTNFTLERQAWQTIIGKIGPTKFSLFYYQYPLIKPLQKTDFVNLASLEDIAAMKLHAISDRGSKKDFFDFYHLLKTLSLPQIFNFYDQKYGKLQEHKFHIIKSLIYFEPADQEAKLNLLDTSTSWSQIKTFFETLAKSQKI